jgi:hypothetical protein
VQGSSGECAAKVAKLDGKEHVTFTATLGQRRFLSTTAAEHELAANEDMGFDGPPHQNLRDALLTLIVTTAGACPRLEELMQIKPCHVNNAAGGLGVCFWLNTSGGVVCGLACRSIKKGYSRIR